MELRHLRYFIRAAELQNFTRAAETLYVSQPTLSVQIQQLEQELGAELFDRIGRTVRLTQAGEAFLIYARQAVRTLEEGTEQVGAIQQVLRGNLAITGLPLVVSKLLTKWVPSFKEQFPEVRIHLRSGPTDDIESAIANGDVDLGFASQPRDHDLQFEELFEEETVMFVDRNHPLAKKKTVVIDDLRDLPLALPSARLVAPAMSIGKLFEEIKLEPRVELTCDDGHALIELVRSGLVATLLPPWAGIGETGLHRLTLPPPGIKFKLGVLYLRLTPASSAFLDLIKSRIDEDVQLIRSTT